MAISDWATPAMATTCTRAANRGRLAADVLNLLDFEVSHLEALVSHLKKNHAKASTQMVGGRGRTSNLRRHSQRIYSPRICFKNPYFTALSRILLRFCCVELAAVLGWR